MTKKHSTKKALMASALSLLLCFSMLVGTTFAWFTDSVTSANNIIKSGNLDIELEYWNGTDWVDVAGKSDILTNTLWEPGVTEIAYLRVANAGSLALKYQLGVNIVSEKAGVNVAGEEFKLSDYIQFGVVENVNGESGAYANREAAVAAVTGAKKISAGYTKADSMAAGTELYLALVVWMPTDVGNVANHNGTNVPQIDLGINVFATQMTAESDSFNDKYDKDAWHPDMEVTTAADLQAALNNGVTNIALADDIDLEEPIVIPAPAASTYSLRRNTNAVVIDLNGKTITAGEDGYVIKNENGATVVLKDSANGGEIKGVVYNAKGSVMTINGGTYTAVSNYAILNDAATLTINSGIINGTAATYPIYSYNDGQQLTINDVTINGVFGALNAYGTGTVEINGGTYNMTGVAGKTSHIAYFSTTATVVINGGSFNHVGDISMSAAGGGGVCLNGSANVTINGGSFNGDYADIYNWSSNATLTINGGTFAHNPGKVAEGYEAKQNTDGSYSVVIKGETLTDSVQVPNAEVYVPAGTYTFPSNVAEGVVINCAPGTVFTGKTGLNLPGATVIGATFKNEDIAVSGTINGTFQNCTFEGSEALRWCYSTEGETVVFENCVIKTDFRGFHFDGMNGNVIFRNCEINGFNACGGTGTITFEGCTFGYDESKYNGLNMYCNTVLKDCKFEYVSDKTNFVDMEGIGKTLTITNCTATLDGEEANVLDFVGGSKLNQNTVIVDGMQCALNSDQLVAAINAGAKAVVLAEGDYALHFTNNTNFNLNDMTIKGLGDVNLAITSTEAWYGRVQGSNVTFENIHFTSSVGATGEATYNNCTFDSWAICASSNKEETTFNNCTIKGCLNTSTDFSSGDVFVNNCKIAKAEYSGSMTMNFVDCQIDEIIIWNANTNLTNCQVTELDDSNVTTATVTIK